MDLVPDAHADSELRPRLQGVLGNSVRQQFPLHPLLSDSDPIALRSRLLLGVRIAWEPRRTSGFLAHRRGRMLKPHRSLAKHVRHGHDEGSDRRSPQVSALQPGGSFDQRRSRDPAELDGDYQIEAVLIRRKDSRAIESAARVGRERFMLAPNSQLTHHRQGRKFNRLELL